jgi:hypothetical protein
VIAAGERRQAGVGVRHLRWTLRSRMAEHPTYLRVARRRHGGGVVAPETELVIDGFTRSASTFAVVAFQLVQPEPVRVGHHLHAPSQMLEAVRLSVPVLLTVRPPEDTVLSLVVREPYVTIAQGLNAYARFHRRLLPALDAMVVADFDEVTNHLDRSIDRVNARFGTSFATFDPTPELTQACFDLIEMRARRPPWGRTIQAYLSGLATRAELDAVAREPEGAVAAVPEHRAQRPSAYKEARKDALREAYHAPAHARLRAAADDAYGRVHAAASR